LVLLWMLMHSRGYSRTFFALGCHSVPTFITSHDTMQKILPFLLLEQLFRYALQNAFLGLLISIHVIPNFLAFESFSMLLNTWKWLIEQ